MNAIRRIAFYSHDTMGLGHLRRCLKMANAITERVGALDGLILTGSSWSELVVPPAGFRFAPLPPVVKTGAREYRPRDPAVSLEELLGMRRAIIDRELLRLAPELLVVDNVPCGLHGEVLPALVALRRQGTKIVLSLRDVLDEESTIRAEWQATGAMAALAGLYDEIWLFGDRDSSSYRLVPPKMRLRTVICGHLGESIGVGACSSLTPGSRRTQILVTGGGGADAGALVTTYVAAVREYRPEADHRIVLGPDFPPELVPDEADIEALGLRVVGFERDMAGAIRDVDLVVSMAGYNTVCEVLAAGRKMVLVPRVWPRREQWLRASRLAATGRAEVVHPYSLCPGALWAAVERALSGPVVAPVRFCGGASVGERTLELLPDAGPAAARGASA